MRFLIRLVFEEHALGVHVVSDFSEAPPVAMALHRGLTGASGSLVYGHTHTEAAIYGCR